VTADIVVVSFREESTLLLRSPPIQFLEKCFGLKLDLIPELKLLGWMVSLDYICFYHLSSDILVTFGYDIFPAKRCELAKSRFKDEF